MNNTDLPLARFHRLLSRGAILTDPHLGFRTVCRWIGADPGRFDRRLRAEFGLGGEAIMARFRQFTAKKGAIRT